MPASDTPSITQPDYYRQLCEHVGVALIATDEKLKIRVWNGSAARMFGAASERMIGTRVLAVIPRERRRMAERMLAKATESGAISEFEFQHRDEHGKTRHLAVTVAPVVADSGERIGASLAIRDITRVVALQAERFESRKLGALGQMAGMIAHHFNNIVGGVITSINFANQSADPALKDRVLIQTERALTRATSLVHGLLVFAEGDQHSGDLADLTEILGDCADWAEQAVTDKKIELVVKIPGLPVLPIPRVQLTTVLQNLAQNAIDAMADGGTLTIEVALTERKIKIKVSDTGVGLEESVIPRIFEPFWTTKQIASGAPGTATGLGLAVAYGIVQVMGGSIDVRSELHRGSRFTVSLPKPRSG